MNRFASNGPVEVILAEKEGQAVYQAWLKNDVVAEIHLEDWENPEVDFYSREAVQILADTYKEVFASAIQSEADIDTEGDMIKHPDGTTTDVPEGKEKGHPDEENSESSTAKMIIIHLNELVNKAQLAHAAGNTHLETAFLDEAENFAERIASLQVEKTKEVALNLMHQAEQLLVEGLDCTAEIEKAESLLQAIALSKPMETPKITVKAEKKLNLLERFAKHLFNYE